MKALETGHRIGEYEVVGLIRQGGSGSIYDARSTRDGGRVALKVPDASYLGDIPSWERFRREVALAERLKHPLIAEIKHASDDPEQPYLAVEFVDGVDLEDEIRRSGPLSIDRAIEVGIQLCQTLEYIHEQRVIHRDLKPANIMIQADGMIKLVDFGIARPLDMRRITWKGLSKTFGTPSYMAPEQVQGGRATPAVDIYALGCILYEMLAGRPPFESENAFQVMNWQVHRQPPPLREHRPDVPEWLEAVVMRALEKRPAHRYASAAEMRHDLESRTGPAPLPEGASESTVPRFIWIALAAVVLLVAVVVALALAHSRQLSG